LGEEVTHYLPFVHAIAGCDTSRLFGIGKCVAFKKIQEDSDFRKHAHIFVRKESTNDEIKAAGEKALLCLYGGRTKETLESLCMRKFREKVVKSLSCVQIQNLPPTPDVAKYHSFRVYYQVQLWMGRGSELNPEKWGWRRCENGKLEPRTMDSAPAPEAILKIIRCGCKHGKGECYTAKCTCKRHGLECTDSCSECKGVAYRNVSRIVQAARSVGT
jgi:hypothetical protein